MEPTQKPKSSLHAKGESPGKRVRFGRFIRRVMGKEDMSDSASQTGSPGSSRSIDGQPTPPESAHDRQNLPEGLLDNKSEAGEKPIQSDSSAVENPFSHAVSTELDDNSKKRAASRCRDQNQGRDLWMHAYLMLQKREPKLAELYENHLTTHNFLTGSLTPESAKSIVEKLLQEREKKQWRINLFQKEVKIREQAEKLIKFLLVSDNVIKTALT